MAFLIPGAVFVHIPKTGGQWVAAALERVGLLRGTLGPVHASPDQICWQPEFRSRAQVFAFVRHPLTWYQSMWAHRMDEEWEPIDDLDWFTPEWVEVWREFTDKTRSNSFPRFVEKSLHAFSEGFVSGLYRQYTRHCTYVGRQETLANDLAGFLCTLDLEFNLERLLSTEKRNVRGRRSHRLKECSYPPSLIEAVLSVEGWTIDKFSYEHFLPLLRNKIHFTP